MNLRDLNDNDMSLKVWRYMPFSKFVSLLTFQAIWFPKLKILQDQYEGKIPKTTKLAMEEEYGNQKKNWPKEMHWQFEQMASKNEEDSRELILASCWYLQEEESERMWLEYGSSNDAVAIQSTIGQLRQYVGVPHDIHATHMGRVSYVEHDKYMMSSYEAHQGHERAFIKDASKFSHESELRIATLNTKTTYCVKPTGERYTKEEVAGKSMNNFDQPGLYVAIDFRQLVSKIVVCPNADEWLILLIQRIMALNQFNIPVERSMFKNT